MLILASWIANPRPTQSRLGLQSHLEPLLGSVLRGLVDVQSDHALVGCERKVKASGRLWVYDLRREPGAFYLDRVGLYRERLACVPTQPGAEVGILAALTSVEGADLFSIGGCRQDTPLQAHQQAMHRPVRVVRSPRHTLKSSILTAAVRVEVVRIRISARNDRCIAGHLAGSVLCSINLRSPSFKILYVLNVPPCSSNDRVSSCACMFRVQRDWF